MNINEGIEFVKNELDRIELVLESVKTDYKSIRNVAVDVFGHMIKYELVKYRQDGDWLRSIRLLLPDKYKKMMSSNVRKMFNDNIDDIYNDARKLAYRDLKDDYTRFTAISPIDRPDYFNIDNIMDKDWIYKFLIENACSDQPRRDLNIKEPLTNEQIKASSASYTLKQAFPGIK